MKFLYKLALTNFLILFLITLLPKGHVSAQTPPTNFKVAFIGDTEGGADFEQVLNLIKNEGTNLVMQQGDFGYGSGYSGWTSKVNSVLGTNFPFLGSDGNHDNWSEYQVFFKDRLSKMGLNPNDLNSSDYSVVYQGLKLVFVKEGGNPAYIQQQFAGDNHTWKICSWHKNQNAMQVGGKGDDQGWESYENCRLNGAIIATAHEHSYHRTKTLTSTLNQTVDPTCSNPNQVCVNPGRTFVFVSGLGGKSIRNQDRCQPFNYPYGCNGEWAKIYTSDQGAQFGALFIIFNYQGNPNKAHGYFKNVSGIIIDEFDITAGSGSTIPPQVTNTPILQRSPTPTPILPTGPPTLRIFRPVNNQTIQGNSVTVFYNESGDLTEVNHVHLQMDNQPEIRDLDNDGVYTFNNVTSGTHTILVYLARVDHTRFSNPESQAIVTINVTTAGGLTLTPSPNIPTSTPNPTCAKKSSGDANCDGSINLNDYDLWRAEFNGQVTTRNADFNNDSNVSLIDFEIWRRTFTAGIIITPTIIVGDPDCVLVRGGICRSSCLANETQIIAGCFPQTVCCKANNPSPTIIPTVTATPGRSPTPPTFISPPPTSGTGIWISAEEIRNLPISGQSGCDSLCSAAWNGIISRADSNWSGADLSTYSGLDHSQGVWAAALAAARLTTEPGRSADAQKYRDKAIKALNDVIGTETPALPESGGGIDDGSLAAARQFLRYVTSADILGYTNWGSGYKGYSNYAQYMYRSKFTFRRGDGGKRFCEALGASNGSNMSRATCVALAAFLADKAQLDSSWLAFRRFGGDYGAPITIEFSGSGGNWYHNDSSKLGINPKGSTCAGSSYPADGVIPNDQGRGGNCPTNPNSAPGSTQYPWEGLQGVYAQALMLYRLGYKDSSGKNPFQINDSALLRAVQYQKYLQDKFGGSWYDSGRAAWVKHLAYKFYGYKPISYDASDGGRNMSHTQWTHQ